MAGVPSVRQLGAQLTMPLKRHPALQDLSRDHQRFLMEARAMMWIAIADPRAESLEEFLERFTIFWEDHGHLHLVEEETVLLPACFDWDDDDYQRLLNEHQWLYQQVENIFEGESIDPAVLGEVADGIIEHVRFEERSVFERIQAQFNDAQLYELGEALLAFRREHRPPDAIGPYTGDDDDLL